MKLCVVIPALNEAHGIGDVLREIPIPKLRRMGYEIEVIVVDNGSVDGTAHVACMSGATVVMQPMRGYGNAYKAGFAYATGDVVATGDGDLTYPFSSLPKLLARMEREHLEFVNTDRLSGLRSGVMTRSHVVGNRLLSLATKILFGWPFKDSQSGMWVFKRYVWDALDVRSSGMPFSQELKIEAFVKGFRCDEVPIDYRARAGKEKLNTITDGLGNTAQLVMKRISLGLVPARSATARGGHASAGQRSRPPQIASAAAGDHDASAVWDERWYDIGPDSESGGRERGPHLPLPALPDVNMLAGSAGERRPMVVWRPRQTAELVPASVLARRPSADCTLPSSAHVADTARGHRHLSN